ncbi:hypothetical protein MF1_03780 [Bartonella quintana]|nr:hypothetical protein RM11_0859 [Bartonella quintana RM-11]BBL53120.1 hypothetical protein MF1_03780 [Bartonella quintana]
MRAERSFTAFKKGGAWLSKKHKFTGEECWLSFCCNKFAHHQMVYRMRVLRNFESFEKSDFDDFIKHENDHNHKGDC